MQEYKLRFNAAQRCSARFCLDNANSPAINVEQVIGLAVPRAQSEFTHGNTPGFVQVDPVQILYNPAGQFQLTVNVVACGCFGLWHALAENTKSVVGSK